MTRAEWERRALELAEARHITSKVRVLAADAFRKVFGVPRGSGIGEDVVLLTPFDGRVVCASCIAGQRGRPCWHAGTVLQTEAERLAHVEAADTDRWTLIEAGQW